MTPSGDVFLANDYPSAISFQDMRFQSPSGITISSILALLTGLPSGVTASVSSGTVPSGSFSTPGELLVDQLPLSVGEFLTTRLDTSFVNPAFSQLDATIVIGHEHQEASVGGRAEIPVGGSDAPASLADGSGSSFPYVALASGLAAGVLALGGGGWYAKRRWLGSSRRKPQGGRL